MLAAHLQALESTGDSNGGWPILMFMFSSYILEGWLILHLLMCSSFIGRVTHTGL